MVGFHLQWHLVFKRGDFRLFVLEPAGVVRHRGNSRGGIKSWQCSASVPALTGGIVLRMMKISLIECSLDHESEDPEALESEENRCRAKFNPKSALAALCKQANPNVVNGV